MRATDGSGELPVASYELFSPKFPDLERLVGLRPGRMVRQATRLLSTTDLTSEFTDHFIRRRLLSASLPVDRAQRVPGVSRTLCA
jgi:hypothetical protein